MRAKRSDKLQAIELRKQGASVSEIANQLKVAKSSVSVWVRNVPLTDKAEKILLKKITAGQLAGGRSRHNAVLSAEHAYLKSTKAEFSSLNLNRNHYKLLCSLIYWCEGAKNTNPVAFTNSDPELVALFLFLFRNTFDCIESKFRVCVHLHSYHDQATQIAFWSQVTNIPVAQFIKPYKKQHSGTQIHENYQGCVSIRYYNTDTARQLQAAAKAAFSTWQSL
jgi:transposase-like protein